MFSTTVNADASFCNSTISKHVYMKHFTLLFLSLLALQNLGAAERSQGQLIGIAGHVLESKMSFKNVATRGTETLQILYDDASLSVAGYQKGGFVVLAKDEAFSPVLGYSVTAFDAKDSNPGFQMWLKATAHALATKSELAQPTKPKEIPVEVASFVTTKWNQGTPYNNLCPSYTSNGTTKHYPTGCVATAMAQAMYYYKHPAKGEGKHTYRFDPGSGVEETVSVQLDDYPLDWDNMIANYKSDYTDIQAKAVAELMMVCGASVDMQYTASGSGTQMTPAVSAFRNNFGFDVGLPLHSISFESSEEYYPALYRAIAAKIPVVYAGASDQGGHCFVLDGYDEDGLFSVNWGWGGSDDGMYNILTLNGYTQQQQFIPVTNKGVYPQYASRFTIYEGAVEFSQADATHIKVSSTNRPLNVDGDAYQGNLYVVAQDLASGKSKAIATFELKAAVPAYYYATDGNLSKPYITITNKLEDGDYRLFLGSKSDKETDFSPFRTVDDKANSALMTIKGGVITSLATDDVAGWMATTTGISSVVSAPSVHKSAKIYNINGQQVDASYHGIVVKNGKKVVQ